MYFFLRKHSVFDTENAPINKCKGRGSSEGRPTASRASVCAALAFPWFIVLHRPLPLLYVQHQYSIFCTKFPYLEFQTNYQYILEFMFFPCIASPWNLSQVFCVTVSRLTPYTMLCLSGWKVMGGHVLGGRISQGSRAPSGTHASCPSFPRQTSARGLLHVSPFLSLN